MVISRYQSRELPRAPYACSVPGKRRVKTSVLEDQIAKQMAEITGDAQWASDMAGRKTLILEHKMAAQRMGFEGVFAPLYAVAHLNTALMDGTLPIRLAF